jgi:hypothetical protein
MRKLIVRSRSLVLLAVLAVVAAMCTVSTANAASSADEQVVPAAPSNLTAKAVGTTSVYLTWTNNATSQSGVVISLDGVESVNVQGATVSSYTWNGLSPGTKYWFYVASKIYGTPGDPTGSGNTQSAWVGPVYATTPSEGTPPTLTPEPSLNYSGYSVYAKNSGLFTIATANWTLPKVNCSKYQIHDTPRTAVWVGLWGSQKSIDDGTAWLPQTGTISWCNYSLYTNLQLPGAHYAAFWEIASGDKEHGNSPQDIPMSLHPGDEMSASVEFDGAGPGGTWEFRLTLFDVTDNQGQPGSAVFDQVEDTPGPIAAANLDTILQQGGAVVESMPPSHSYPNGLAEFSTPVHITNMQVASDFTGNLEPTGYGYTEWVLHHATRTGPLLAENSSPPTVTGATQSSPGVLSYTITWKRTS